jgi:hypothetical protein
MILYTLIIVMGDFLPLKKRGKPSLFYARTPVTDGVFPEWPGDGDLAFVEKPQSKSECYYYSNGQWVMDTGRRPGDGQGSGIIHFPHQEWSDFILIGEARDIHWKRKGDAYKSLHPSQPFLSSSGAPHQSHTISPHTPILSPRPPSPHPDNVLYNEILLFLSSMFPQESEVITTCRGPLTYLTQCSYPIRRGAFFDAKDSKVYDKISISYNNVLRDAYQLAYATIYGNKVSGGE